MSAAPPEPLPPVLLVGCGKMGAALLEGWLARGVRRVGVVEPYAEAARRFAERVELASNPEELPGWFVPSAVVLAVKPQEAVAVVPRYAEAARGGALVLSIMAGKTLSGLDGLLGGASVVRAMPNTPAAIGRGFTVACAARGVTEAHRRLAEDLLAPTGEVAWVEAESLLDPVTAVSGGGPAYVFLLAELLERAGVEQGVPPDLARRMARATVSGAGALLEGSEEDAAALRRAVTSPGGTTERALEVLRGEQGWPALVSRAVDAATRRSRELAG